MRGAHPRMLSEPLSTVNSPETLLHYPPPPPPDISRGNFDTPANYVVHKLQNPSYKSLLSGVLMGHRGATVPS